MTPFVARWGATLPRCTAAQQGDEFLRAQFPCITQANFGPLRRQQVRRINHPDGVFAFLQQVENGPQARLLYHPSRSPWAWYLFSKSGTPKVAQRGLERTPGSIPKGDVNRTQRDNTGHYFTPYGEASITILPFDGM